MIIFSCSNREKKVNEHDFDFAYEIRKYYGDTLNPKNLSYTEFYDSTNRLVRVTGLERGCTRYFYGEDGKLKETIWGRNCLTGLREIYMYDKVGNLKGTYKTRDSLVNLDTVSFKKTHFYDITNRLIKQLEREGNFSNGQHFEIWNYYHYAKGKISEVIVRQDEGLLWNCKYVYDEKDRLKEINRKRGKVFEIVSYSYDNLNRLTEEKIQSNEYPLTPETSFSAGNNKTLYRYNAKGYVIEEVTYSHKGKVDSRRLNVRRSRY